MVVADFGAGGGYFALPAARAVGSEGKVYTIDIQRQAIDLIRSKATLDHLLNIETVWADLERPSGSHLPDASVDLVIVANILFQAEDKRRVIAEAHRVARSGGRLAILEWDETPFPAGPPKNLRIAKAAARRLAQDAGFELENEFEAGTHHYGLLFKKQ
jgi:ubiquinone/menaquinone biosynthesis C-methylase UbiE